MIIRSITIRNFGAIDFFSWDLSDGINIIRNRQADELAYVIGALSNHKAVSPLPPHRAREDTKIEATVCVSGFDYQIVIQIDPNRRNLCLRAYDQSGNEKTQEYLYLTSHSLEQDLSESFRGDASKTLFRLIEYLYEDQYFDFRELSGRTDRMSEIKAFRAYLRRFLKEFTPETIREGKRYELCLAEDGKYVVRYKDDHDMPALLSESEQMLFRYLCFLRTAEFWQGFEELRNLNGIKKPLIIEGFLERLDESIDVGELLKRTLQLQRQTIILSI